MQIGRCKALQELVGRTEIGLRLTGKTDDHVDPDKGVRHQAPHGLDPLGEFFGRIAAAHPCKHAVRTALKRDMKVMLEFR